MVTVVTDGLKSLYRHGVQKVQSCPTSSGLEIDHLSGWYILVFTVGTSPKTARTERVCHGFAEFATDTPVQFATSWHSRIRSVSAWEQPRLLLKQMHSLSDSCLVRLGLPKLAKC